MPNVLIVGGAGFIGSHLVARCVKEGHAVHVLVRPETNVHRLRRADLEAQLHILHLDDRSALERCFAATRPDYVYYLAAATRRKQEARLGDAFASVQEDLIGLLSTIAAAAETQHPPVAFVRAGTLAAYGGTPLPHVETQREVPKTTYAAALVAGGHYIDALQPRLPFPIVTARLSLVFGPAQSDAFLIPSLIRRCLGGERSIIRRPNEKRDLLFVDDAVEAMYRLSMARLQGASIVNIASGNAPTMREVAALIVAATGADPALIELLPTRGSDDVDLCPSPALAAELFGWKADISLHRGIARTVFWWRENIQSSPISG
ncbi:MULTISPECIES: NAD-dependent epimerase/dehydratase family protein [unclassified Ensifer]|uniref:NAD-dependent epimerase/dehydratase family protein n=1 Tax=unclassified Ensifer TaxID=2633371 RepID=UPI0008137018|nr:MULTISPECIES: NAD-dependent epimerase/dehydratase family protein [unclassified Ensifer]